MAVHVVCRVFLMSQKQAIYDKMMTPLLPLAPVYVGLQGEKLTRLSGFCLQQSRCRQDYASAQSDAMLSAPTPMALALVLAGCATRLDPNGTRLASQSARAAPGQERRLACLQRDVAAVLDAAALQPPANFALSSLWHSQPLHYAVTRHSCQPGC